MRWTNLSLALLLTALGGCATLPASPPAVAPAGETRDAVAVSAGAHDNFNSTLWMQTATEYQVAALGSFNLAIAQLDRALADPQWDALPRDERAPLPMAGLPAAVIVDADETMVDNSPYQARAIRDGVGWSAQRWTAWVNERRARAIPGAVAFAVAAEQRGVKVFYVTNRSHDSELAGTADNLRALGFPIDADNGNLVLMGDPRAPEHEKGTRRKWVGQRYRVLLMLGDNLGDFIDGFKADNARRAQLIAPYGAWWGERWIMLPNPAYGSWEAAARTACADAASAACREQILRHD